VSRETKKPIKRVPKRKAWGPFFCIMVGDTGIEPSTDLLHVKQALIPVKTTSYSHVTLPVTPRYLTFLPPNWPNNSHSTLITCGIQ
jgi:hypothetical protein